MYLYRCVYTRIKFCDTLVLVTESALYDNIACLFIVSSLLEVYGARFKVLDSDLGLDLLLGSYTFKVPAKPCTPRREVTELDRFKFPCRYVFELIRFKDIPTSLLSVLSTAVCGNHRMSEAGLLGIASMCIVIDYRHFK